ncbi:MAG: SH3 domain-containing protein [Acidobacteriota bacterium]
MSAKASGQTEKLRIIIATGVRLRAAPTSAASEVARLGLGVVVKELNQSTNKERVGDTEEHWYEISSPDGKQGWVFGAFAPPFYANERAGIYRKIASDRLKIESATFAEWSDLEKFLSKAITEIKQTDVLAELEFGRLVATRRAAESIPPDQQQEMVYQNWIKAREKILVYSEPAGQWLVRSDLFWDLQKKYSALAIAEQIAWAAANNLLPGECEGYVPCHLYAFNQREGRYLKLYPQGPHANEAVDNMAEQLEYFVNEIKTAARPDAEPRAEAQKELRELRAALTKVVAQKKAIVLRQLDALEKYFR